MQLLNVVRSVKMAYVAYSLTGTYRTYRYLLKSGTVVHRLYQISTNFSIVIQLEFRFLRSMSWTSNNPNGLGLPIAIVVPVLCELRHQDCDGAVRICGKLWTIAAVESSGHRRRQRR